MGWVSLEALVMRVLSFCLIVWLTLLVPVSAAPTAEEAKALVDSVVEWCLVEHKDKKMAAEWSVVKQHPEQFSKEFFDLMAWVSVTHPGENGLVWYYGVDPLWQNQAGYITKLTIGPVVAEGENQLVVLNYVIPSILSEERPPSSYKTTWVIGENPDGKAVIRDVHYQTTYPTGTKNGSALVDMRKAKARFKSR